MDIDAIAKQVPALLKHLPMLEALAKSGLSLGAATKPAAAPAHDLGAVIDEAKQIIGDAKALIDDLAHAKGTVDTLISELQPLLDEIKKTVADMKAAAPKEEPDPSEAKLTAEQAAAKAQEAHDGASG